GICSLINKNQTLEVSFPLSHQDLIIKHAPPACIVAPFLAESVPAAAAASAMEATASVRRATCSARPAALGHAPAASSSLLSAVPGRPPAQRSRVVRYAAAPCPSGVRRGSSGARYSGTARSACSTPLLFLPHLPYPLPDRRGGRLQPCRSLHHTAVGANVAPHGRGEAKRGAEVCSFQTGVGEVCSMQITE